MTTDTIEISVTESDIAAGMTHSPSHCPIAQACRRVFGLRLIRVRPSSHSYVTPQIDVGNETFVLPDDANQRALDYDRSEEMEPFKFELPAAVAKGGE